MPYGEVRKDDLAPGSMVFKKRNEPVDLKNYENWWQWKKGASWKHPYGHGSSIIGLENHPVVHIAYEDAEAYTKWAGKELSANSGSLGRLKPNYYTANKAVDKKVYRG